MVEIDDGQSLPRQCQDHLFQGDVGISVGFFTETTGSLCNPETRRRAPSYTYSAVYGKYCPRFYDHFRKIANPII